MDTFIYRKDRYYSIGEMEVECSSCQALGYQGENRGTPTNPHFGKMCCGDNKYIIERIPDPPEITEHLFRPAEGGSLARRFQDNPRMFNSGVALGAVKVNDRTVRASGPSAAFKICGEVKRSMSGIVAEAGQRTNCIQTYFCDPEYQDRHRADFLQPNRAVHDPGRQKDVRVFQLLREALTNDCSNRYSASFKQVIQHLRESNIPLDDVRISLKESPSVMEGQHPGQFHLPRCPEMAILFPQQVPTNSFRQIVCEARATLLNDGRPRCSFFNDTHQSYTPIMYPVLFSAWH